MIKAVILAGGKGTRLSPLTFDHPKPTLKVLNKSILEHNLNELQGLVKEAVIVVGYKREKIESLIGSNYKKIKITYAFQEEQKGTGDAIKKALPFVDKRFIVLNGDDFYFKKDIKKCLQKCPSILLSSSDNPSSFGVVDCYKDFVRSLVEKPLEVKKNSLVNTGLYFLDKSFFNDKIKQSERGEYELTDYIKNIIFSERLYFVKAENWIPVSYAWNLFDASNFLMEKNKKNNDGNQEKNTVVSRNVVIEKGALIKHGSIIEDSVYIGAGSVIGPNSFIRKGTVIGKNCFIGSGVEIKNSIIGDNSAVPHLSYIGDSIIGENCNIGGGTVIANLRFDGENIKSIVKNEKIDTGRKKMGAIIADNVKIGVNCSLAPGVSIGSNSVIGPHSFVKNNIEEDTVYYNEFKETVKKKK